MGQHQLSKSLKLLECQTPAPRTPSLRNNTRSLPAPSQTFCGLFHVLTEQAALALTSLGVLLDNRRRENRADLSCKTAHDAPKHVKEVLLLAPFPISQTRLDLGRDLGLGVGDLDG